MTQSKQVRKEQALQTRRRMLDAAYRLFCEQGYPAITMQAIAREAGVAVQTVYFTFHTKAELMIELVESVAGGPEAGIPVLERSWQREAATVEDGRRAIALVVEHGVEIYRRMAPLNPAFKVAASLDSDVHSYYDRVVSQRKQAMRDFVATLQTRGQLRQELGIALGGDIVAALLSHETYLLLVIDSHWPVARYKWWVYRLLCHELLDESVLHRDGDPTAGLSFAYDSLQ